MGEIKGYISQVIGPVVDIRHQRDVYSRLDARNGPCGLLRGHRHTHDLAARLFERVDLRDGGLGILSVRVAHRLDRDRRAAADSDAACDNLLAHKIILLTGA